MQANFQVRKEDAAGFAHKWTHNGVAIVMPDIYLEFARDFANVVLASFIETCKRDAVKAAQIAAEKAAPKIVLTD